MGTGSHLNDFLNTLVHNSQSHYPPQSNSVAFNSCVRDLTVEKKDGFSRISMRNYPVLTCKGSQGDQVIGEREILSRTESLHSAIDLISPATHHPRYLLIVPEVFPRIFGIMRNPGALTVPLCLSHLAPSLPGEE